MAFHVHIERLVLLHNCRYFAVDAVARLGFVVDAVPGSPDTIVVVD